MTSKINNAVRPEHTVSTVVATEEQQLLELVLQSRAPKKQAEFTLLPSMHVPAATVITGRTLTETSTVSRSALMETGLGGVTAPTNTP
jgi:hypothetical protein